MVGIPLAFDGRTFEFLRASDIPRDGMAFEAWEGDVQVAEVFYCDQTGKSTFTAFQENLPVELVKHMVNEGLAWIVPVHQG